MPKSKDVFQQAYDQVIKRIGKKSFKTTDIITFAGIGMEVVEKFTTLSGPEKKHLVVALALKLNEDYTPEEQADEVATAINLFLPGAIDLIVSAAKGQLKLNKTFKKCFTCK